MTRIRLDQYSSKVQKRLIKKELCRIITHSATFADLIKAQHRSNQSVKRCVKALKERMSIIDYHIMVCGCQSDPIAPADAEACIETINCDIMMDVNIAITISKLRATIHLNSFRVPSK